MQNRYIKRHQEKCKKNLVYVGSPRHLPLTTADDPYLEKIIDPITGENGSVIKNDKTFLRFGKDLWEQ